MTMTPLNCHGLAATILLLVFPTATSLVPQLSIRKIQAVRNINSRKIAKAAARKTTRLSLGVDPHVLHDLHHHAANSDPASALDTLSSLTLAKASALAPNQSVAPLAETIKSTLDGGNGNLIESIPDLPSMPGGTPRTGNAFLSESFREWYGAPMKSSPMPGSPAYQNGGLDASGALAVPAREWDVVARYADLLDRVPVAAAAYALLDFFVINAEEDLAIVELLGEEEELDAIAEVESRVVVRRLWGLLAVVTATIAWSLATYHPVPFNEL